MPRKPQRPRKDSDPEQLKRFKEMAREVEVDEDPKAFDRAFDRVTRGKSGSALTKAKPVE